MEQLSFIVRLFDFTDVKVQMAAFYGIIASLICTFSQHFLGISAGLFLLLFAVMITDYITGLKACKKEGGKFQSRRGLQWVFKFGSYLVFLAISFLLRKEMLDGGILWIETPMRLIHYYILVHIFIWETKSIDENFIRLGYSFQILKLGNELFVKISELFKKKINE